DALSNPAKWVNDRSGTTSNTLMSEDQIGQLNSTVNGGLAMLRFGSPNRYNSWFQVDTRNGGIAYLGDGRRFFEAQINGFYGGGDAQQSLGASNRRWTTVYATQG